jgi:GntR family transcriptional regulator
MLSAPTPNGAPKYERLAEALEDRVRTMPPDDSLPTERELLEEYGVSRATVRQAIRLLVQRGLVYNIQGSGTYVANPAVVSKTLRLTSFSEDMRQRGFEPASEILRHETVEAPAELAARLKVPVGAALVSIGRLRLADSVPMALENSFLVAALVRQDGIDPSGSIYQQLERAGLVPWRAAQTIGVVNLDVHQAQRLDQAVGAAALRVERVSYTKRGDAFEYAETVYRGDRYNFDIVVGREL